MKLSIDEWKFTNNKYGVNFRLEAETEAEQIFVKMINRGYDFKDIRFTNPDVGSNQCITLFFDPKGEGQ